MRPTFDSQVVGPAFEFAARLWTEHFAATGTIGGQPDHVGPSTISMPDGSEMHVDVLVAADDADVPSRRTVLAMGEARSGEGISPRHLERLERARAALAGRAAGARLLLFGTALSAELTTGIARRSDVELIDLARLHHGR